MYQYHISDYATGVSAPLRVGAPDRCLACPPIRPALYISTLRAWCSRTKSAPVVYTVTTLLQRFKLYYLHQIPLKLWHAEEETLGFPVPCSYLRFLARRRRIGSQASPPHPPNMTRNDLHKINYGSRNHKKMWFCVSFISSNSSVTGVRFPAWLGIFFLSGQNSHPFFRFPRDFTAQNGPKLSSMWFKMSGAFLTIPHTFKSLSDRGNLSYINQQEYGSSLSN